MQFLNFPSLKCFLFLRCFSLPSYPPWTYPIFNHHLVGHFQKAFHSSSPEERFWATHLNHMWFISPAVSGQTQQTLNLFFFCMCLGLGTGSSHFSAISCTLIHISCLVKIRSLYDPLSNGEKVDPGTNAGWLVTGCGKASNWLVRGFIVRQERGKLCWVGEGKEQRADIWEQSRKSVITIPLWD